MESDKIIIFPLNLDAMLRACVPGGSSCDPQKVSDAIREWCGTNVHQLTVSTPEPAFRLQWRAGQYAVNGPNLGDTAAFSRDQFLEFAANNAIVLADARSAPTWIDVRVAEELRKRLQPGEKVIWRDAFRWKDDAGALSNHYEQASVASLAAEFDYTVILDAGCAAIIRDPRATQCPAPAPCGESVAELNRALGKAFPDDQVSAIKAQGAVLPLVNRLAERLALMDRHAAIDNEVIQMLIAGGYITNDVADQAFKIAHGFEDGPLKSASSHSWWKDVKPETDLAEANHVIDSMLKDWQKVGEALGFKNFADPENIIYRARELSSGTARAQAETPAADEFADIREFRRRAAEMDRQDAERAAAEHEQYLKNLFPRTFPQFPSEILPKELRGAFVDIEIPESSATKGALTSPHISGGLQPFPFDGVPRDGAIPVYAGDPEFDALPIGAGSIPEAPAPMAAEQAEPKWKRDDEKTMLRILLLSAETTGFHGNEPAVHMANIAKWTDDECRAVDEWCVAMHHQAGDSGVIVPPKPIVLAPASFSDDARPESICRRITKLIAAETRYPEHHFTPVAMTIAQMFTDVDQEALELLDGVLAKFKHDDEYYVHRDLIALRSILTKNKRLHS